MESNLKIDGKVAFITGSTRGIGWSTAKTLASAGATLIIHGHSNQDLLDQRVNEIKSVYGTECIGLLFGLDDIEALSGCYQQIFRQYRRLDILVNNAGMLVDGLLGMVTEEIVDKVFRVNAISSLLSLQEASRLMVRNKSGSIINVTSILGVRGMVGHSLYSSTKAALIGLTLSAAKELAPNNVRVNAVAPGLIDTDMTSNLPPEKLKERISAIGLGRMGTAQEVANVILFLASGMSSYVTGQILGIDGGMII